MRKAAISGAALAAVVIGGAGAAADAREQARAGASAQPESATTAQVAPLRERMRGGLTTTVGDMERARRRRLEPPAGPRAPEEHDPQPSADLRPCTRLCPPENDGSGGRAGTPTAQAAQAGTTTPALTAGPYPITPSRSLDPSVAASSTHVVLTNYNAVRFLGKDGKDVTATQAGTPIAGTYLLRDFFAELLKPGPASMSNGLNLPGNLKCDPQKDALLEFDPAASTADKAAVADCVNGFYDAHVRFDDKRKRFVMIAAVRNGMLGGYLALPDAAERVGRRTRIAIAVSKSQNPLDGWYTWWVNGEWGLGECNDLGPQDAEHTPRCPQGHLRPGDAVDYPLLGMSARSLLIAMNIDHGNWRTQARDGAVEYTRFVSIPLDPLVSGASGKVTGASSWNDTRPKLPDGDVGSHGRIQATPVTVRSGDPGRGLWVVNDSARNSVIVLADDESGGYSALTPTAYPVGDFDNGTPNGPQPGTDLGVAWGRWGGQIHTAELRGSRLYTGWQVCHRWSGMPEGSCAAAVKALEIDLGTGKVLRDRTLGRATATDSPAPQHPNLFHYGWPAVVSTATGALVASYSRSSEQVPLESRVSVWYAGEKDIRPSRLIQAGSGFVKDQDSNGNDVSGADLHFATAAPEPNGGVWAYGIHAAGTTHGWTLARVLGKSKWDYSFEGAKLVDKAILVKVANNGDKAGPAARLTVRIPGPGTVTLRRRVPPVPSGGVRAIRFPLPAGFRAPRGARIGASLSGAANEISRANNRARLPLRGR